jgi:hypothetical protein
VIAVRIADDVPRAFDEERATPKQILGDVVRYQTSTDARATLAPGSELRPASAGTWQRVGA